MCLCETCDEVRICKHLYSAFPVQNGQKQQGASSLSLFSTAAKYVIRRFQENQEGVKLNWTQQFQAYADDVTLPGKI
jgi:hypothetical protein